MADYTFIVTREQQIQHYVFNLRILKISNFASVKVLYISVEKKKMNS